MRKREEGEKKEEIRRAMGGMKSGKGSLCDEYI